ncbi:hypothetical protein SAMN02910456_01457 [Ruminococcaceae bacterium YRB3002]|nr:hypothetical protein SAMN02910456_01457 [Ruminococcaceae bacterium YRB3002]
MKRKLLAVVIAATMMLTACCSCGNHEDNSGTGPDDGKVEETEKTTTSETTSETTAATTASETTVEEHDGPVQNGSYIIFGHYEQDGNESNGPEPIEWIKLSEEDGKVLLMSRYILDYQAYNNDYAEVTWETCSLRKWLNEDFLNAAFNASEQEQILTVINSTPDNVTAWGTSYGGNDTEDKIFLLSSEEAAALFANDDARAVGDCDWWWLRSPGYIQVRAAVVLTIGEIFTKGHVVNFNYHDHGVRPVLWLDVDQ